MIKRFFGYFGEMDVTPYIFLVTIVNMVLYHRPLFRFSVAHLDLSSTGGWLTLFAEIVALFTVNAVLLHLIALISLRLLKLFMWVMMVGNAIALYFIESYQVILDRTMMGNVFHTDMAEATSYYHPKLIFYLLLYGFIPAMLLWRITIRKTKRKKIALSTIAILVGGVVLMYANAGSWLWIDKYAKRLGGMSLPWSYAINAIRYKSREIRKHTKQRLLPEGRFDNQDKTVVVLVIGESARAANFSLYGYARNTNPKLSKIPNVTALKAHSTATYTTASVHSMLSHTGASSGNDEPLPNYLQRIGAEVIWRTTNWGTPKLHVSLLQHRKDLIDQCQGDACDYDGILLAGLKERLLQTKAPKVLMVLHTSTSHGPTYYQKYPPSFEHFKPVCKSVDLKTCSQESLINAYDNTILYTDHLLSKIIEVLRTLPNIPSVMIYMSDHGESLGEYGLYLHGTPYAIAPDFQKKIPLIIWESDAFIRKKGKIDQKKRSQEFGQDVIFHTVAGALDLNSSVYDPAKDLFNVLGKK